MKMLKAGTTAALVAFLTWAHAGPAGAQDLERVDTLTFKSFDLNGDGKISRRELLRFNEMSALSMDADGDETISSEEFLAWDLGYLHLGKQTGKAEAVNEAKRQVFESCDLNQDGKIHIDEFSVCSLYNFYRADLDRDGALNQAEFTREFRIVKTMRSALE